MPDDPHGGRLPEPPPSEADAAGRLEDDPGAQPELTEEELGGDRPLQPPLEESELAPPDDPDDS